MSWFKVVVGFVIMIGVLIAWFKVMAHLKGGSSSGFKFDKPGRKGRGRDNDLERFIAAHRSGAAGPVDARPASAPPASAAPASPLPVPPPAARAASAPSGAALEGPLKVAYLLVRSTYPELVAFPNFAAARVRPRATACSTSCCAGRTSRPWRSSSCARAACRAPRPRRRSWDPRFAASNSTRGSSRAANSCASSSRCLDPTPPRCAIVPTASFLPMRPFP